jgi:two-component system, sensor histidine kinase PdtaS
MTRTLAEEAARADGLATELAEAVHRAKNDIAAISAMLQLQAAAARDGAVREALEAALARVQALARVNAQLDLHAPGVATETTIDASAFLSGLATDMGGATEGRPIRLETAVRQPHRIPVEYARPLGLIANEWVVNALKYAFPGDRSGSIRISLSCIDAICAMQVVDDGVGTDAEAPPQGTGLGRRLVWALATRIKGGVEVSPGPEGVGTLCRLSFPLP